jgi:hypothetical protein
MALRIHLPWGWLLTALTYAGLAAGMGWVRAVDYDGHLVTQLALDAAGGLLLGGLAWTFSERVAEAANLHTRPALRLSLAGLIGTYAGVWVAAPCTEFVAGTHDVLHHAVAVVLYAAAGILPLVATLALLSVLETLLAAQRGGSSLGSALRSAGGHAALGLILGAVSGYTGLELREEVHAAVIKFSGDNARESGWLERRRTLFREVLKRSACDVLVAPVETVGGAQAQRGLDRAARSLITREIAAQIEAQTGLCVLDPTLVARALGESARETSAAQVWKVSEAAGVAFVVRGSIEVDPERQAFSVSLSAFARPSGKGPWAAGEAVQWSPIAFTDEVPPEAAFAAAAPKAGGSLGLLGTPQPKAPEAAVQGAELPASPEELAADAGSALARARRLQLLAQASGDLEPAAEHLWERSIVALRETPADEAVRVTQARAALHLQRRPYALRLLQGASGAEARVLFELAQGNVRRAQGFAAQIVDPTAQLIAQLEIDEALSRYGADVHMRERRAGLAQRYAAYAALLPAGTEEPLQPAVPAAVRAELQRLGVAIQEPPLASTLRLVNVYLRAAPAHASEMSRHVLAIERSYAPLWRAHGAAWRAGHAADRLADWDYIDALYTISRAALGRSALDIAARRESAGALVEAARDVAPVLSGYPPLAAGLLWPLRQQSDTPGGSDLLIAERERRLRRDVVAWEGAETRALSGMPAQTPYRDEPPRAWRLGATARDVDPQQVTPELAQQEVNQRLRALSFAQYDVRQLVDAHHALRLAGRTREADQLASHARDRFVGSPARERFLLEHAEEQGDAPAYVAILEETLASQPDDWHVHYRLAMGHLLARHPEQAQRTLLAFPGFAGEAIPAANRAAFAYTGGALLLDAGEATLARALFEQAVSYKSGSAAHLLAELQLAVLDQRWMQVRETGKVLYENHKDPTGAAYAAVAAFVTGAGDEGFRTFFEASKQIEDFRPWSAALAGHRVAQTKEEDLVGFARRWSALSGNATVQNLLRHHFLFNALIVDRASSERTVQLLSAAVEKARDTRYKAWVNGYSAFKRGNFAAAADTLTTLVTDETSAPDLVHAVTAPALPYVVAGLIRSDRGDQAQALLDAAQQRRGRDFHVLLAQAYAQGLSKDHARAELTLWQAHIALAETPVAATVPAQFQLLEACENLLQWTGDERYRALLLDLARRQRQGLPSSYSYAFEAKHSTDAQERGRALGMALYLDPQSEHLVAFTKPQREAAAEAFQRSNPFATGAGG